MSEITHQDYMSLVERIEKLEGKVEALSKYVDKQLQEKYFGNYEEGRKDAYEQLIQALERRNSGETKCFFETLSPEDRNKPTGISCPCRKCSPYSMGG